MGRKKKKGAHAQQPPPQKKHKAPQPTPEELKRKKEMQAFDTTSNKYTDVINKKIRNVNKKLHKIEILESKDQKELNEDQLSSIARREGLEAERARLVDIQNDLIAQALNEPKRAEEEVKEQPDAQPVFGNYVQSLIKLNSVTRLPMLEEQNLPQTAQGLGVVDQVQVTGEVLQGLKLFWQAVLGSVNTQDLGQSVGTSTQLAMNYVSCSDEVDPISKLSYRQLNILVDAIFELQCKV